MKNFLRISALLTVALMVFIMIGCGSDTTETTVTNPKLVSTTPASGGTIAANGTFTMAFDKPMSSVTVTGAAGTVTLGDGKNVTWKPTGTLPTGALTLTISGTSTDKGKLDDTSVSLTVQAADTTPPDIDGAASVPANGATGLDPATVTNITIAFTEAMDPNTTKLDSITPTDIKHSEALSADGKSLVISFLGGYKLGNEMTIDIKLVGTDLAGNALKTTNYTFTTMAKQQ